MSAEAYQQLIDSGRLTERQAQVWRIMLSNREKYPDGMTAREIAGWLEHEGDPHRSVHSRLRELEKIGVVECKERRRCHYSHRMVNNWRLK